MPTEYTIDGLVEALVGHFEIRKAEFGIRN
jgi:hypothetical protein